MTEKLYTIADSQDYFRTGISSFDGTQALCGRRGNDAVCLRFSADGRFLDLESKSLSKPFGEDAFDEIVEWMEQLGFDPGTIHIKKFAIADHSIELRDFPDYLEDYIRAPSQFPEERQKHLSQRFDEWRRAGSFVLIWDEEYEMSADGDVEST